jgi:hypothetical protein
MATTYKVFGQVNPAATTATTLYTVPAATQAIVNNLTICNQGAAGTFRVAVRPAGEALATKHYLAYDTPIAANDSITPGFTISLGATDVLTVYVSTANMSITASGVELT